MIYIILAMLFYTVAILFGTSASRHAHPTLVAAIVAATSAIAPVIALTPLIIKKTAKSNSFGIWMAVFDGLAIGLFSLALLKAFSQNKVGIVTPIVFGGSIFLATAASYFIFKEKISMLEAVGLVLLAAGFIIITYARLTAK